MSRVGKSAMVALALAQALVSLDASVVNVALPRIQETFGATSGQLQLVVVAYMIVMAAFVLPIGALSDRVGRRPIYLGGLLAFAFGSLLCGLAWSTPVLIGARGIQGLGAGCLLGLALAILTDNVERDRIPHVVAVWTTVSIAATAGGPFVGGILVTALGWRSVFLINVPLIIGVFAVARFVLADDRREGQGALGLPGAALLAGVLGIGTLGLTSLERGRITDPIVFVPLLVAAVMLVLLVVQQRRTPTPLVQWSLIRVPPLPVTLVLSLLLALALAGSLYQMALFTQNVLGFSPALSGSVTLAASLCMAVLAPIAPRIQRRFGAAAPVFVFMLVAAGGLAILARLNTSSTALLVVLGLLVLGIGLALSMPIVSAVAMQQAAGRTGGAISGTLGLVSQVAAVLGIVLMGSLATGLALSQWAANGGDPTLDTLVGVGDVAGVTSAAGASAGSIAANAYAEGVSAAFIAGAVVIVVAAFVALMKLPRRVSTAPLVAQPAVDTP